MAKSLWRQPDKESDPFRQPAKKSQPVEARKATYEKSNVFGKSEKYEGRAAGKASRKDKGRWK